MRILFPYMARWHSANRTRFHHLLSGLARRGHSVVVLQPPRRPGASDTNFHDLAAVPEPRVDLQEIPAPALLWNRPLPLDKLWKKGLATLLTSRAMKRIDREEKVDVVLLYNIPQVVLSRACDALVAVDVADDLLSMLAHETGGWTGAVVGSSARRAWRALLARADLVTAASSVLAERLDGRATVLPNGADLGCTARAEGRAFRERYGKPLIGFVGAFEYFIDFDLVLEVARRMTDCTFLLVGSGRDRERVAGQVRTAGLNNVHLPGAVPYALALDYMAAFDVALLPFAAGAVADSASPLKLFEYVALRKPVVSTPAEEVRRLFGNRVHFGAGADEWVGAIRRLLAEPERARETALDAFREVETRYRWDLISERFEALLLNALSSKPAKV